MRNGDFFSLHVMDLINLINYKAKKACNAQLLFHYILNYFASFLQHLL